MIRFFFYADHRSLSMSVMTVGIFSGLNALAALYSTHSYTIPIPWVHFCIALVAPFPSAGINCRFSEECSVTLYALKAFCFVSLRGVFSRCVSCISSFLRIAGFLCKCMWHQGQECEFNWGFCAVVDSGIWWRNGLFGIDWQTEGSRLVRSIMAKSASWNAAYSDPSFRNRVTVKPVLQHS